MAKIELFFSPQPTRSARARWAFIETQTPFEGHVIDIFKGEHKTDEYRAIHPLSRVPVARFDGSPVIESSALALMASIENADAKLIDEVGTPGWRQALQWAVFAPAELDPILVNLNDERLFLPPAQRSAERLKSATERLKNALAYVERALESSPYLLGDRFSVADICVGHSIVWTAFHGLVEDGTLKQYLERLQARPAFQEVYGPKVEVFPDPHAA